MKNNRHLLHSVVRAPDTIVGYHGCRRSVAERLLNGEPFRLSNNDYDWLGGGAYFGSMLLPVHGNGRAAVLVLKPQFYKLRSIWVIVSTYWMLSTSLACKMLTVTC